MLSQLFRLFSVCVIAALLAGCAAATPVPATAGTLTLPAPAVQAATTTVPVSVQPGRTAVATSATPGPSSTLSAPPASATPDLRLPPERWQEWPVVPTASGTAQDIYRKGLALGNDPTHFSKVGDCQSIREVLMGMFDRPGSYALSAEREHLAPAIEYFQGSFNRDGMAVQGGFNAASVLSPMWANPELCQAGENPLECEYRLHRPSFVIISLEVWWDGRTPERYEQYMRRIIEFSMEKGVVPILSTKADNVEGDNSINLATARLAYEYDLPLWNWWLAAQDLPNGGLDPNRPDGFHLAYSSWSPRAFTALEALDSVWHGVQAEAQSATPGGPGASATATPAPDLAFTPAAALPTLAPTPSESATPPATPAPGSGQVVLGLARRAQGALVYDGVYRIDLASGQKTELAGAGWQFQALSPDGRYLLLNRGAELFLTDAEGKNPTRLSAAFFPGARSGALWSGPDSLAFIAAQGSETFVVHYPLDGQPWKKLTEPGDHPVELYGVGQGAGQVGWGGGQCEPDGECRVERLGLSAPTGPTQYFELRPVLTSTQAALTATPAGAGLPGAALVASAAIRPAWSADGAYFAYSQSVNGDKSLLALANTELADAAGQGAGPRPVELPGSYPVDLAFAPDGARLAVLQLDRSEYSGRWGAIYTYLVTPGNLGIQRLSDAPRGLNPRAIFSSDGRRLLLAATQPDSAGGEGSRLLVQLVDLQSKTVQDLSDVLGLSSPDLLLATHMQWAP